MCLDLFSEETPVCRILGGRFDLGSIAFIYLFIYLFILRKLDLLRLLTEGGIEFQLDTLILVKVVFLSSIFWNI